jgi:hypothetical protein
MEIFKLEKLRASVLKDLEARQLTGDGDAGLIAQAAAALAALRKPAG